MAEPTLNNTIGALLLGLVCASLFSGITTVQAYWYYHRHFQDSLPQKCSVAVLWVIDVFHLALTVHVVYHYVVTGYGDTLGLANVVWSVQLQTIVGVVVVFMVQSLYARRVWILGGHHKGILGYIVAAVVISGAAMGITFAYKMYTVKQFSELRGVGWAVSAAISTATAIDIVIAGSMCHYLLKSKGSQTRLNSTISTIMQYILCSGCFISACSLATILSYIFMPHTFIFVGVSFLLTKVYIGSYLAMLNARPRVRDPQRGDENFIQMPHRVTLGSFPAPLSPSKAHATSVPW